MCKSVCSLQVTTHMHQQSLIHVHSCRKPRRDSGEEYVAASKGTSLLSSEIEELSGIYYRPRTRETRSTYEVLLSFLQQAIGDQVGHHALVPYPDLSHIPYHLKWYWNENFYLCLLIV